LEVLVGVEHEKIVDRVALIAICGLPYLMGYLRELEVHIDIEVILEFFQLVGVVHEGEILARDVQCFRKGNYVGLAFCMN